MKEAQITDGEMCHVNFTSRLAFVAMMVGRCRSSFSRLFAPSWSESVSSTVVVEAAKIAHAEFDQNLHRCDGQAGLVASQRSGVLSVAVRQVFFRGGCVP